MGGHSSEEIKRWLRRWDWGWKWYGQKSIAFSFKLICAILFPIKRIQYFNKKKKTPRHIFRKGRKLIALVVWLKCLKQQYLFIHLIYFLKLTCNLPHFLLLLSYFQVYPSSLTLLTICSGILCATSLST